MSAEPSPEMTSRERLHAYLTWIEDEWLPALRAGRAPDPRSWEPTRPRPTLTVIRGGRAQ